MSETDRAYPPPGVDGTLDAEALRLELGRAREELAALERDYAAMAARLTELELGLSELAATWETHATAYPDGDERRVLLAGCAAELRGVAKGELG